jgi:hypothetical protein
MLPPPPFALAFALQMSRLAGGSFAIMLPQSLLRNFGVLAPASASKPIAPENPINAFEMEWRCCQNHCARRSFRTF